MQESVAVPLACMGFLFTLLAVGCGRSELGVGGGTASNTVSASSGTTSSTSGGVCGGADLSTNPANCGACGHDCLGGACVGGNCQPVLIVIGQYVEKCLAIDDTYLYWAGEAPNAPEQIMKMALTGGTPVPIAESDLCTSLAAFGSNVYWTDAGQGKVPDQVRKAPKAGGATTVLASEPVFGLSASSIAVDAAFVYWGSSNPNWMGPTPFIVNEVPLGGGAVQTIGVGGNSLASVAVGGGFVYWVDGPTGTLSRAPAGGGPTVALATGPSQGFEIAVDGTNVYWTAGDGVLQVPVDGGTPITLATFAMGEIFGDWPLVADTPNVYFVDPAAHSLVRVPVGGGPAVTMASGLDVSVRALVQDAKALYWAGTSQGSISMLAK